MVSAELAMLALSITINAALWYRIGQLETRLKSIEDSIVVFRQFKENRRRK